MSDVAERFGIWKAWNGRCAWCREPVEFRNSQKEHLLPRDAEGEIDKLREEFGLPDSFEIESFKNWAPSCVGCNVEKRARVVRKSDRFLVLLQKADMLASLAESIASKIDDDSRKAPLLARVAAAVDIGQVTKEEIVELLEGLPAYFKKAAHMPEEVLYIAPGLEVVEAGGRLIEVRDASARTAITISQTMIGTTKNE